MHLRKLEEENFERFCQTNILKIQVYLQKPFQTVAYQLDNWNFPLDFAGVSLEATTGSRIHREYLGRDIACFVSLWVDFGIDL